MPLAMMDLEAGLGFEMLITITEAKAVRFQPPSPAPYFISGSSSFWNGREWIWAGREQRLIGLIISNERLREPCWMDILA